MMIVIINSILVLMLVLNPAIFGVVDIITSDDVIRSERNLSGPKPILNPTLKLSNSVMTASSDAYQNYWGYTLNQLTPGFKRNKVYMTWDGETVDLARYPLYVPGAPTLSNRSYDMYIQNPSAYFYVQTKSGALVLTRDGRFIRELDTGYLITIAGNHRVLDDRGDLIQLSTDSLRVTPTGQLFQSGGYVATLAIVSPVDLNQMVYRDGLTMGIDPQFLSDVPEGNRLVKQGSYEAAIVPKGLKVDDHGVFKYLYMGSSYVAKRNINMMRQTIRLNN